MLTKINRYVYDENNALIIASEILIEHKIVTAIFPTLINGRYKVYCSSMNIEPFITDREGMRALFAKNIDHKGWVTSAMELDYLDESPIQQQ